MSTLLQIDLTIIVKKSMLFIKGGCMQIEIPDRLKKLADLFPVPLYVVGGYLRNCLLGIAKEDIDICSSLKVEELETLLKGSEFKLKIKSKILGSALVYDGEREYEYTCFRRDIYPNNGSHMPESVEFVDDVKEDAKRRDFTCNALYYDIKGDKILDFYNGVDDIKHKILRTVQTPDEVLSKDGVRILRMFRFECELNFKIDKQTYQSALKYSGNLRDVSGERVIYEIKRILHSPSKYPGYTKKNAYMKVLNQFNKASLWPIFKIDCPKIKFNMVKKVEHKSQGFLIDVIDTVNPFSISYYLNLILTESFGMNKKMTEQYINILSGYYEALNHQQNKPYFFKYYNNFPSIYMLLVCRNKYLANKYQFFYKYIISHKIVVSVKDLKITGEDIKKRYPSVKQSRYKPILESLLSDIFDGKLSNEKEELLQAVESKLKYL